VNPKLKKDLDKITDQIASMIKSGELTTLEQDTITEAQQILLEVLGD